MYFCCLLNNAEEVVNMKVQIHQITTALELWEAATAAKGLWSLREWSPYDNGKVSLSFTERPFALW